MATRSISGRDAEQRHQPKGKQDRNGNDDAYPTLNMAGRLSMCCLSVRPLDGILGRMDLLCMPNHPRR